MKRLKMVLVLFGLVASLSACASHRAVNDQGWSWQRINCNTPAAWTAPAGGETK